MKKVILGTIILGALATVASADCAKAKNGGYCTGKITRLYVNGGMTYIATDGDENKMKPNCQPVAGAYSTLLSSNPNYKTIHATLLAAQLSGKKASVRSVANKTTKRCEVAYVVITN